MLDIDYEGIVFVIKQVQEKSGDPLRPYQICTIIDHYTKKFHGRVLTQIEMIETINVMSDLNLLAAQEFFWNNRQVSGIAVSAQMEIAAYFDNRKDK